MERGLVVDLSSLEPLRCCFSSDLRKVGIGVVNKPENAGREVL